MKINFDCSNCRQVEIARLKEIDDKANEGKRFYNKQKTKPDPETYRVEATEITIQSKFYKLDIHDSSEEHPRAIEGCSMVCAVCGKSTFNYIHVGITDI